MFCFLTVGFLTNTILGLENSLYDLIRSDVFNIYRHVAIATDKLTGDPFTEEDISFYLYTNDIADVQLNQNDLHLLDNKKIVFLIHGWTNSKETSWYEDIKDAFLKMHAEYSIVEVDWRKPATQCYFVASINTYAVAKVIANFILNLNKEHNVSLDNIILIGHSLGGQISGFVGKLVFKQTGQKLPRIIALDPAGPLFVDRPDDKRLNKHDAKVVEVIHSDGGTFGFKEATGTIDFYPNGGNSQPGCMTIDLADIRTFVNPISCDHSRAAQYLIEAIFNQDDFPAKKCTNWHAYKKNSCEDEVVTLGNLTTTATGNFYLETNKGKPFAKRMFREEKSGLIDKVKGYFQG